MTHSLRCEYLSLGGMSVMCLDSYCPSRHTCDHVVKPSCWGATHSDAGKERERVLDEMLAALQNEGMAAWDERGVERMGRELKIIKVKSCCYCPYRRYHGADRNIRSGYDSYRCEATYKELARELAIVVSPMSVNPITQEITKEVKKTVWSNDRRTEWDGKIPEWCPLDEPTRIKNIKFPVVWR